MYKKIQYSTFEPIEIYFYCIFEIGYNDLRLLASVKYALALNAF